MKLYLTAFITAFCCYSACAQGPVQRNIRLEFIKGDSTRLSFNEQFNLIEDSCSQVYRYAHLNIQEKKFTGSFKDVSRADQKLLITQGTYSAEGLKEGPFIINYLNGTPQAKGNFKNDLFDGKWSIFYDTGKPLMTFEANGADIKIIDVWDDKGVKTVNNGNGTYRADKPPYMYWKGKLLNGRPDGKWKAKKAADDTDLSSETFKNGAFQKGNTSMSEYTDNSRIVLISPTFFPFVSAEYLLLSRSPCDGDFIKQKNVVDASYSGGTNSFSDHIGEVVASYLNTVDLKSYDDQLVLEGEITEQGSIAKLKAINPFNISISQGVISKLHTLPRLKPATVDGKPVKQGFSITLRIHNGMYSFNYRFLQVTAN